ncbi:MAG: siderophore-interacting protein, partial [Solirubrobacteraceae bacterium]|nr:siderophore-interacting protein [Solirubrobacteraceae bacterium]
IPSIARRLGELPAGSTVVARIEVDGPADELELAPADGVVVDVEWLHRGDATPGDALVAAVTGLDLPEGDGYAWVATEAEAARTLRRHLREERGLAKGATKVTGYWKLGASDHHDAPDDA